MLKSDSRALIRGLSGFNNAGPFRGASPRGPLPPPEVSEWPERFGKPGKRREEGQEKKSSSCWHKRADESVNLVSPDESCFHLASETFPPPPRFLLLARE